MSIDFEGMYNEECRRLEDIADKAIEKTLKGEHVSILSLIDIDIDEGNSYTIWIPPGSGKGKLKYPYANLENLIPLYDKIIIPINCYEKSVFEICYAMKINDLANLLKNYQYKFKPILIEMPNRYKGLGLDPIFKAHERIPFAVFTFTGVMHCLNLISEGKEFFEVGRWKELIAKRPDLDINYIVREVRELVNINPERWKALADELGVELETLILHHATNIFNLRNLGYSQIVNICHSIAKLIRNPRVGYDLCCDCYYYLVAPLAGALGGFTNYSGENLEEMAFLHVLPTEAKELKDKLTELLEYSPASRSLIVDMLSEIKALLNSGTDMDTIMKLLEIAEDYSEIPKATREFKFKINMWDLDLAYNSYNNLKLILEEQYNRELNEQYRKGKVKGKITDYLATLGFTAITTFPSMKSIPSKWKLIISMLEDQIRKVLNLSIEKLNIDVVVSNLPHLKPWPLSQNTMPYMVWKPKQYLLS